MLIEEEIKIRMEERPRARGQSARFWQEDGGSESEKMKGYMEEEQDEAKDASGQVKQGETLKKEKSKLVNYKMTTLNEDSPVPVGGGEAVGHEDGEREDD